MINLLFFIFLFLLGIVCSLFSFIGGLTIILASFLCIPFFSTLLLKKIKGELVAAGLCVFGLLISFVFTPQLPKKEYVVQPRTTTTNTEKEENAIEKVVGFAISNIEKGKPAPTASNNTPLKEGYSYDDDGNIVSDSSFYAHFIDVGQADSILVECDGEYMLIDAGDNSSGTKIQSYLNKQGCYKLKYFIMTHPDADHIGGADVIITKFDIETLLAPNYAKDTATFRDVVDAIKYKDYSITEPICGDTYTLGSSSFTILGPIRNNYEDVNNFSIVIKQTYGDTSFLFMGDAMEEEELDILASGFDLKADVLKVGHHGSKTSTTGRFISAVDPKCAVISCGEGNDYGHPHAEVLNSLRSKDVLLFRTDEMGTVVVKSNKEYLTWNAQPSKTWAAGN